MLMLKILLLINVICWTNVGQAVGTQLPHFPYNRPKQGLTRIPDDIKYGVTQVFLQDNNIVTVANHKLPKTMKDLYMYGNNVREIPSHAFATLIHLQTLDLQNNNIHSFHPHAFAGTSMRYLSLGSNKLPVFPDLDDIKFTLMRLRIANNLFTTLSEYELIKYRHLVYLEITRSPLKSIGKHVFRGINKTANVTLNNNELTVFPDMSYTSIRKMELHGNDINTVSSAAIQNFSCSEKLDLSKNKLTSFPDPRISSAFISHLHLGTNPLVCDCHLAWVKDAHVFGWMTVELDERPCKEPHELVGKCWNEIRNSDLLCDGPDVGRPFPTWTPVGSECKPLAYKLESLPEEEKDENEVSRASQNLGRCISMMIVGIISIIGSVIPHE